MKRKNIDCDNSTNKKICYSLISLEKYKKDKEDKEVDKSFNKRKNIFYEIDNNKKIKTYHEEHEDYNCYDFDMNYNKFYNGNISYENYIK
jgi:hypothetical protein